MKSLEPSSQVFFEPSWFGERDAPGTPISIGGLRVTFGSASSSLPRGRIAAMSPVIVAAALTGGALTNSGLLERASGAMPDAKTRSAHVVVEHGSLPTRAGIEKDVVSARDPGTTRIFTEATQERVRPLGVALLAPSGTARASGSRIHAAEAMPGRGESNEQIRVSGDIALEPTTSAAVVTLERRPRPGHAFGGQAGRLPGSSSVAHGVDPTWSADNSRRAPAPARTPVIPSPSPVSGAVAFSTANSMIDAASGSVAPAQMAPRAASAAAARKEMGLATTTWTPVATANIALSPAGNDSTCARSASEADVSTLTPCKTFLRAYILAQPGDTIATLGGQYPAEEPSEGATKLLPDPSKTALNVTFVCGDGNLVTFASPADQFVITAQHVTIRGGCFHFNRLWVGDGSNGVSTSDVTVDGVSMMMFDISGSSSVTVENSTVGPDVACYAPGAGALSCQPNTADNEAYFAAAGRGNTNFNEPKVHDGGASGSVPSSNVTISNDTFLEIQSRDPINLHAGCLWIGYASSGGPLTVTGNTFSGCMTYDIHVDTPQTPNVAVTNNTFGTPKDALRGNTDFTAVADTPNSQVDYEVKCQDNETLTNYTITGNTFSHGYDLDYGGCTGATYLGLTTNSNSGGITLNPQG
jgi:hypothetical protein